MKKQFNWRVMLTCLVIVYVAAAVGSLSSSKDGWYESVKPSFTPPDYVFPIVWGVLYFLIALSIYFAWMATERRQKPLVAIMFAVNLIANMLWTYFFFGLHMPMLALVDLALIWLTVLALMIVLWAISRKASLLLAPYLLWVSFAGALNAAVAFG